MIRLEEIRELALEWGLPETTVEKEYVLGWLLSGIARHPEIGEGWVFKGGTCLKKCYMETWRFSEDLDFTVLPNGSADVEQLIPVMKDVLASLQEESGIQFGIRDPKLRVRTNGKSVEGRIYFRSITGMTTPVSVKLDLTKEERVVDEPVRRPISHVFSDQLPTGSEVLCYSFVELFAEKIRAMGERSRPRDLYDIANLYWRTSGEQDGQSIRAVLVEKCEFKGIPVTTYAVIQQSPYRGELESEWENMLGHQLRDLPPLEHYMSALPELFAWIEGRAEKVTQPTIAMDRNTDTNWRLPATVAHWGTHSPMEAIRFAAANHLCVELGYDGSTRLIEPYSLRKTLDGNIILYARKHESGEDRSYRVDRIESARVTHTAFFPVYRIEIASMGILSIPPTRVPQPRIPRPRKTKKHTSTTRRPSVQRGRSYGPKYIVECPYCQKRFTRSKNDTKLRKHKMKGHENLCSGAGRRGYVVEIK